MIDQVVFERIKEKEAFSGVYLFVSNDKEYLRREAKEFGRTLLDFQTQDLTLNEKIFETDKDYISAEMVDQFIDFEVKKAVKVRSKLLIMHDIELIQNNIADKLLKTIEDHNNDSLIIFTTTNIAAVLNTIKSRCMIYKKYVASENYFETYKNKYLLFIEQVKELKDFNEINDIVDGMQNLGPLNVIQAMFVNLNAEEPLKIAEEALNIYLGSPKDEQLYRFLVYSFYMYFNGGLKSVVEFKGR